jgi:hypothetical protein
VVTERTAAIGSAAAVMPPSEVLRRSTASPRVVKGDQPVHYRRIVKYHGTFLAQVHTLGFLYELTPPVPINVLKGNILSSRKVPPRASAPARPDRRPLADVVAGVRAANATAGK